MKIILNFIVLTTLINCYSNSIATKISNKTKGNYYVIARSNLIKEVDTLRPFSLFEKFHIPSAEYKGCIFQEEKEHCINWNNWESINSSENITKIDRERVLTEQIKKYIEYNYIDSMHIIDKRAGSEEYQSQLIKYSNNKIITYKFQSSLNLN